MEPAANRTQANVFRASFQAFLENVLVPDCRYCSYIWDRTIKLDSVMRRRSSCTRRTKSTVDYDYDYDYYDMSMVFNHVLRYPRAL